MPQAPDDRKHWSRSDIERYLSGQMPDAERHALERAALDDPFLADAMEGLQQRTAAERNTDLDALSRKIAERTDEKVRRIGGNAKWWWAAAASLLLLVGGTWYWQSGQDASQPKITQVLPNDTVMIKSDTSFPSTQKDEIEKERLMPPNAERSANGNTQPITTDTKPKTQNDQLITHNAEPITHLEPSIAKADDATIAAPEISTPPVRSTERAAAPSTKGFIDASDRAAMHYFKGRVVDEKGQGVPFANIQLVGGGAPTYADAKGEFKVTTMDSSITLTAHAVGFQDVRTSLHISQPTTMIMMVPSTAALSEVVVTGYAAKNKKSRTAKAAPKPVSTDEAEQEEEDDESEPLDGWIKYEQYLNNNSRMIGPDPSDPAPEVEIYFMVSPNGTPYDVKVERSSSPKYEKEALRLLREGPKWQAAKPGKKPLKGSITMQF